MDTYTSHVEPKIEGDELPPFSDDYKPFKEATELTELRASRGLEGQDASRAAWWLCKRALDAAETEGQLAFAWDNVLSSFAFVSHDQRITLHGYTRQKLAMIRRTAEREKGILNRRGPRKRDFYGTIEV